ncbi:MAG: sulfatase-like hydrolase/transferase [Deltaproteobacteria bacterium]|jgi:arylsulfatase A-like enzyme
MKTTALTAAFTLLASSAYAQNVLVIIGDDIAVDKVSSYAGDYPGYAPAYLPQTDAIDGLAAAGLRFTRAWATPLCSPTRVSFQTGKHPFRTGIGTALGASAAGVDPDAHLMLAESFQNFGYVTGMFGKWHMGTEDAAGVTGYPATSPFFVEPHPHRSGWMRFFGLYSGYPGFGRSFTDWPRVGWVDATSTGYAADETAHHTNRTSAVAVNWISNQTEPWMAVVAFSAPHSPDTGSSAWQYGDADVTRYRTPALSCLATSSCGNEPLSVYQGLAEHVDLEIEDLLNGIPDAMMDETLIIFFGDNGTPVAVQESTFAVGRGKGTTYENGVRVPFIVTDGATWRTNAPGRITSPGRDVDIALSSTDIYQTLHMELLSVGVLGVDSSSFATCFSNTGQYCSIADKRYGYSETYVAGASLSSARVGVRYGHDKMVAEYDPAGGCMAAEYYETSGDPMELSPTGWTGIRATRLQDHFTALHASEPSSWANLTGSTIGFCP